MINIFYNRSLVETDFIMRGYCNWKQSKLEERWSSRQIFSIFPIRNPCFCVWLTIRWLSLKNALPRLWHSILYICLSVVSLSAPPSTTSDGIHVIMSSKCFLILLYCCCYVPCPWVLWKAPLNQMHHYHYYYHKYIIYRLRAYQHWIIWIRKVFSN